MKRLVLCCDGTWNTPEMESPTNVVRIARAVPPRGADGRQQALYYDEGVGTQGPIDRIVGGALGEGLDANVRQAYRFVAGNYEHGDEIYLFGFSRGAYTVRSLAGMIGYSGLLRRDQITLIRDAYEIYRKEKDPAGEAARGFRAEHGIEVPRVTLLGCWDTVGALGIPNKLPGVDLDRRFNKRYRWLDNRLGPHVEHALHALAIDERRKEFEPPLMRSTTQGQTLEQVWFSGDHGSVGGGVRHKEPLSRIALDWMVGRVNALKPSLAIDTAFADLQECDHNAHFRPDRNPIYGRRPRDLGETPVFHESAIRRYRDLEHYAKSLGRIQREVLHAEAQRLPKGGPQQAPHPAPDTDIC